MEIKNLDLHPAEELLQYVWQVAGKFMPGFDPEWGQEPSIAPAQFVNRLSRGWVVGQEEMLHRYSDGQIQNTIRAYGLDADRLWYLLLFVRDYIGGFEDAPRLGRGLFDEWLGLSCALEETAEIVLKKENGRSAFGSGRKKIIEMLRTATDMYTMRYKTACHLWDRAKEIYFRAKACEDAEKAKILHARAKEEAGRVNGIFDELGIGPYAASKPVSIFEHSTMEMTHRQYRFAEIMLWFLSDKKGIQPEGVTEKVYKERHFFVSMMLYVCGIYNEEDTEACAKWYAPYYNGKENRNLSSLVSRYRDRERPDAANGRYWN